MLAALDDGVKGGVSLQVTIARLNPVLRGWFGYFKHCPQWVMTQVDGYVRGRLRGILRRRRRRHGLRGRGRGVDHQRWPNAYFAALGLFSLEQAHRRARQPMQMAH
jgi:RNA-directed DNA polymerase